jgi:[acyl-carrier-protein] S-malonyltransferase
MGIAGRPLLIDERRFAVPRPGITEARYGQGARRDVHRGRGGVQLADAALGEPLSQALLRGPADTLTLTHNAQPALLAHGAAVWAVTSHALRGKVRAACWSFVR